MATFTSRLGLRKPELTDQPDQETDLNANWNRLDDTTQAVLVATSSGRPSGAARYPGRSGYEGDTGNHVVWDGTAWRHTRLPGYQADGLTPLPGQLYANHSNGLLEKRGSNSWTGAVPLGEDMVGSGRCEARYRATASTVWTNATELLAAFETAEYTTNDVTPNGAFTDFTLNRAGLWLLSAGFRWASGIGSRTLKLTVGGTALAMASDGYSPAMPATFNIATAARVAAGAVIRVTGTQNSGAVLNSEPGFRYNYLSLAWLRP